MHLNVARGEIFTYLFFITPVWREQSASEGQRRVLPLRHTHSSSAVRVSERASCARAGNLVRFVLLACVGASASAPDLTGPLALWEPCLRARVRACHSDWWE